MKRLRPRWALLAVFALVLAGLGSACSTIDPPALTVGGTELSRSELFEQLPDYLQPSSTGVASSDDVDPAQVAEFLTERVYIFLIQNELEARGIEPTEEDRAAVAGETTADSDYAVLRQEALAGKEALTRALGAEATIDEATLEQTARELYDQQSASLATPATTCLSAILIAAGDGATVDPATGEVTELPTDAEYSAALADAQAAKAKLDAGQDFATVAETDSDITAEQAPGGALGCPTDDELAQLPASLVDVVPDLEVGATTEPIRIEDGYVILTVTSRTEAEEAPPFSELEAELTEQARQQLAGDAFDAWLAAELESADISVDRRFGTWNPETRTVDPPTGATPAGPTTTTSLFGVDPSPTTGVSSEEVE